MKEVYIACAKRTAVGAFLGGLSSISSPMLGDEVIKDILQQTNIKPEAVDEVIMGQVITGGSGQNPARQALIHAGIPKEKPAFTINKVCGSGLKSVALAVQAIKAGDSDVIIAGGQENMSLGMHGSYIRAGQKFGEIKFLDQMMYDGLTDVFSGSLMGITAENIAKKFKITREMQDEFAANSQQKAAKAQQAGHFKEEIIPVTVTSRKESTIIDQDEGIRASTTLEKLATLKPAFDKDGTVTAGSSSTINDGAAAVLVVSSDALKKYNLTPIAKIISHGTSGVDPDIMGTGPVPASQLALKKAGWNIDDLDRIEANEAFAVQAIYVNQNMKWDINKVNVCGGAIALGHPIGASGTRVLVTLIHEMHRAKAKKGLATLCIGGGMGIAMCIESLI
ncbi:MAG: acetyl-CoA C-acetyltransferase [Rickettsiaceae bacterium]|nr:acetyl-CoA C-acetyltransferase [Rickettsiaceae bacterium]